MLSLPQLDSPTPASASDTSATPLVRHTPQASNHSVIASLSRFLRTAVCIFWGRFGLPLPFRTPVTFVRGTPIFVKQSLEPTEEEVNELHGKVVTAVQELFERHKHEAGPAYANKTLEIM